MDVLRGQRLSLAELLQDRKKKFKIKLLIEGVSVDFSCFGLNAKSNLFSDDYLVFSHKMRMPCGSVSLFPQRNSALFSCSLDKLPAGIERLIFTAAVKDEETMSQIQSGYLKVFCDSQEVACFKFVARTLTMNIL